MSTEILKTALSISAGGVPGHLTSQLLRIGGADTERRQSLATWNDVKLIRNLLVSVLQVHYLMILAANWAYLKSAASTHDYQDIKTKDDQDLEAEARSKEGQNSSYS